MDLQKLIPQLIEQRVLVASAGGVSASVEIKRPPWEAVYKNYPKNSAGNDDMYGPNFYKMIFGDLYDLNTNIATFDQRLKVVLFNGCAGKVSMALSLSGCPIVRIGNVKPDFTAKAGLMYDKKIISTASKMKSWLDVAFKKDGDIKLENNPSINSFAQIIGNKKGIYLMLAKNPIDFGASGHVTLWTGEPEKYVFGGHHYEQSAKAMYFWELK